MNVVSITGRIVRQPEQKDTSVGAVTNFCVAVDPLTKSNGDTAYFIDCVAFNQTAELITKYLTKGSKVGVTGYIKTGSYVNKEQRKIKTFTVVATHVDFLNTKQENEDLKEKQYNELTDKATALLNGEQDYGNAFTIVDEDIPF